MKKIYSYMKYREYLSDWYLDRKASGFSYKKFSELAGLNSPNYLKLVISGERNLTISNIHQFARIMNLSFDELQYFEAIVLAEQCKLEIDSRYYRKRAKLLKQNKPKDGVRLNSRELLQEWYFPAIVVALDGQMVDSAEARLSEMSGLSLSMIKEVIAILLKNGLLKMNDEKYCVMFEHFEVRDAKSMSKTNKDFLRKQIKLAQSVLEKRYAKGPKFYAHTFSVGKGSFNEYSTLVDSFLEKLSSISNREPREEILQLNIQLFNLKDVPTESARVARHR